MTKEIAENEIERLHNIADLLSVERNKLQAHLEKLVNLMDLTQMAIADRADYCAGHIASEELEKFDEARQVVLGETNVLLGIVEKLNEIKLDLP